MRITNESSWRISAFNNPAGAARGIGTQRIAAHQLAEIAGRVGLGPRCGRISIELHQQHRDARAATRSFSDPGQARRRYANDYFP